MRLVVVQELADRALPRVDLPRDRVQVVGRRLQLRRDRRPCSRPSTSRSRGSRRGSGRSARASRASAAENSFRFASVASTLPRFASTSSRSDSASAAEVVDDPVELLLALLARPWSPRERRRQLLEVLPDVRRQLREVVEARRDDALEERARRRGAARPASPGAELDVLVAEQAEAPDLADRALRAARRPGRARGATTAVPSGTERDAVHLADPHAGDPHRRLVVEARDVLEVRRRPCSCAPSSRSGCPRSSG